MGALSGHFWTLVPHLAGRLPLGQPRPGQPFGTATADPDIGRVQLNGALRVVPGAENLVVLVHGLGGSMNSPYMRRAARTIQARGWSSLALALRGADGSGADVYHCGQTADLEAVLNSPEVRAHRRVFVLGFSIGGHLALRLARQSFLNLVGVAAVSAPIDLTASRTHMDRPALGLYRRHVLKGLLTMGRALTTRGVPWLSARDLVGIRTLAQWDERVVLPRYGFGSLADYDQQASVAPHLDRLRAPALLLAAADDPMVPRSVLEPFLPRRGNGALEVRWAARGGHLGFPPSLDLGYGERPGLVPQVLSWFNRVGGCPAGVP